MAIVSTAIEFSTQADGSRHVVERHLDDTGREYMRTYFIAATVDLNARAAAYVPVLEQQLAATVVLEQAHKDFGAARSKIDAYAKSQTDSALQLVMALTVAEIAAFRALA